MPIDPRERDRRRDRRHSAWKDRFPEEVTCVRCLEPRDKNEMDRLLWCEECRYAALRRAARTGWMVGGTAAALLALWIWLVKRPSDVIIGGWIATVVALFWLGSRVGREIAYGVMRFRNRRATDAVPPDAPPPRADG